MICGTPRPATLNLPMNKTYFCHRMMRVSESTPYVTKLSAFFKKSSCSHANEKKGNVACYYCFVFSNEQNDI